MSIKIKFRDNLSPLIQKPILIKEDDSFKSKLLLRKSQSSHNQYSTNNIEVIFKELDDLVGLDIIKKFIYELYAFVEIQRKREKKNLATEPLVLHMVFSGNPGTGKTTVARLISRLFKELGLLEKGHIVECERADLVGEYIGHTASKTREMIKKALGGVLFIDEAYSLARGGEKDFGKEAIDTLVKAMEDHKDELVLILAGYKDEMEYFISTNPGIRSRFPIHITFPDYSIDELVSIGELMLTKRQYSFTPESRETFRKIIQEAVFKHPHSGNARMVRNIIEKTIRKQAVRLYKKPNPSREDLIKILDEDLVKNDFFKV